MSYNDTLPQAVIFDFDGTLCDVRSILQYLDHSDPNLHEFHTRTHTAPHNEKVFSLLRDVQAAGITPILISVRGEMWRDLTTNYLVERDYTPEIFHMRKDDDTRAHAEVKREIIASIKGRFNVVAAVDDDPKNVKMFNEEEIPPILVPGYNGTDDPNDMVIPEWWSELVNTEAAAPNPTTALPLPMRSEFSRSGATCRLPVKGAENAPCILRSPHNGNCRSK